MACSVEDQIKTAFSILARWKKRTPLVGELVRYFERRRLSSVAAAVEETLPRLGLPVVMPSRLKGYYDLCRASKGAGLGARISVEDFSSYLSVKHNIRFGKTALKNWHSWGEGTAQPLFKFRARDKDLRKKMKLVVEDEYRALERQLRDQKIISRHPRFVELATRVSRRFGEFSLHVSGVRLLVRELNRERSRARIEPMRFHAGRCAFTDKVERSHWEFVEKHRRAPTYHELANQFSQARNKPCSWQVIRGAYRRINAYRIKGAPKLETQVTQGLYDAEIIDAHRLINREGRPPTMRALEQAIRKAQPGAEFAFGTLRKRVHALRRSGEPLPTRAYEITSGMVGRAYERLFNLFQSPPSIKELRQQVLLLNPEVEWISRSAISLHVAALRSNALKAPSSPSCRHQFEVIRLSGWDRVSMIRRLVAMASTGVVVHVSNLMGRYELPETQKSKQPVFTLQSKRVTRRFVALANGSAEIRSKMDLSESQRTFLRAKAMWGDGFARAGTTVPFCERLVKGTADHSPFTAREWRALLSFALKHVLPQAGISAAQVAELNRIFDSNVVRLSRSRPDLRLVIEPAVRLHSRSRAQSRNSGEVSSLELLDVALRQACDAVWRTA